MLTRRDLAWGLAAQGLNIGLWLVMLPVVLRFLPPAQVALWLVFITIAALAQLLELGFQPTIARNVAYVHGGAQALQATGMEQPLQGPMNTALLAELAAAARFIYRAVAAAAALVLWIGGTAYVLSVTPATESRPDVVAAWAAFSAGYVVNFYFGYLNAFLQGRGDVRQANQVVVVSRLVQLALGCGLVAGGVGLLGLGIASLASTVVGRMLAHRFLARGQALRDTTRPQPAQVRALVGVLWHNAGRYGVVMLGAFLISRANVLIATSRVGLVESASFALAMQVLIIVQTLASLPFNLAMPRLSQLQARGETAQARDLFGAALVAGLLLFTGAALAMLALGNPVLAAIGSATRLPTTPLLAAMCLVFLLEVNHGICANLITTGNQVPFVNAGLFTGLAIALTGWFIAPLAGVAGLLASIAAWQLAYNNWKWPLEAAHMLQTGYAALVAGGLRRLAHRAAR